MTLSIQEGKVKTLKYGLATFFILLLLVCLYELYSLQTAQDKTEEIRSRFLRLNDVKLDDIPNHWLDMLIKIEDPNFISMMES